MARIVQLSDLHLTAVEGARVWRTDVWANLRRTLAHIRAEVELDRMVLTGDLANQRRPETYARLREALGDWIDRVRVVPGNHDSRELLRAAFADRLLPDLATANFVDRVGGWKLVGLDSLRRFRVHGRLGTEQLSWAGRELRSGDAPVLVFVHHPPIRVGTWWLDKDLLRDRRALARIVEVSPVRGFACGHVHQEHAGQFAGARVWTAPSTAYQFRPRGRLPGAASRHPAFSILELDGEGISCRVVEVRSDEMGGSPGS